MNKLAVITGSTRGIGLGMAREFLKRGLAVVISGRSAGAVEETAARLGQEFSQELVAGFACDVTDFDQVQGLWEAVKSRFGRVDIWINNAGIAASRLEFWAHAPEQYREVVETNILGTMYGSKVALVGMLAQGFGALYNMEGFGARGRGMHGMTLYGSTKACLHFLDQGLAQEIKGGGVIVGAIAPGMMITDLVTRQYIGREEQLKKVKPILNIIAERPETVAPVLVQKMIENRNNGVTINFSSPLKVMLKFLTAPFNKRDLFS